MFYLFDGVVGSVRVAQKGFHFDGSIVVSYGLRLNILKLKLARVGRSLILRKNWRVDDSYVMSC